MLRKFAMVFLCLLVSLPSLAASLASRDTLVIDGELVKADGHKAKNKAWGQSTVEVMADGKAEIIAASQSLNASKPSSPRLKNRPVTQSPSASAPKATPR